MKKYLIVCLSMVCACGFADEAARSSLSSLRYFALSDDGNAQISLNADSAVESSVNQRRQASGIRLSDQFLLAQDTPRPSGVVVGANNSGVTVGVKQEFSTWSDLTAIFRPSRWASPFSEGGTLSFLSYKSWVAAPARTVEVFFGAAVVVGGTVWGVAELCDRHEHKPAPEPVSQTVTVAPSHSSGSASSTPTTTSSDSSSGGGGHARPTVGGFVEEER